MNVITNYFLNLPRASKRLITLLVDSAFIVISFWSAFFVRTDFNYSATDNNLWLIIACLLPVSLFAFIKLGLYRAVLRYVSSKALSAIMLGTMFSTLSFVTFAFILDIQIPRVVPIMYTCFVLLSVGGARIFVRALAGHLQVKRKEPVIIYGAGSAGRQLAMALQNGNEMHAVAFLDDDQAKSGENILGIPCLHSSKVKDVLSSYNPSKVLLAIPSAPSMKRKEILQNLEQYAVKVMSIPAISELIDGKYKITDINDIDVADLLGRDSVEPTPELMSKDIKDKNVMVTGAGGSIGSELCRQILMQRPKSLVLFELSEFALYSIDRELNEYAKKHNINCEITPLLGSVQKKTRIKTVLKSFNVQTLYHAAAYKHVPLVEYNVVEGVRNNVFGTLFTAQAAIAANVETMVLVSTDKAVRPTNVMGTTKRLAELVLQSLADNQKTTRFCMVRFGNVLGSSGSVVPLFRSQIASGGPITLTHKDITRYFMTIPEASQLVIQAGAMGQGGDVFVLDMGKPIKIIDLAKKMIHLSGLELKSEDSPFGDIEIKCTGLRPGEKLFEELLIGDNVSGTKHPRIMTANEQYLVWQELEQLIKQLDDACHSFDHETIRSLLLKAPTGFKPKDGISDLVWHKTKKEIVTEKAS